MQDPLTAIDNAIDATEAELAKLREARNVLAPAQNAAAAPTPSRRRRMAKPGQRQRQLLNSIKRHPERTIAQHAKALGMKSPQAHGIAKRLERDGKITRENGKATVATS